MVDTITKADSDSVATERIEQPDRALKVAVMVLAAVALILGGVVLYLAQDSDEPRDAASGPEAVFTWDDDPSQWVTADEAEAMFQSMSRRYAGVDLDETEVRVEGSLESSNPNWHWLYAAEGQDGWQGSVYQDPVSDFSDPLSDPRLPEGVVFVQDWGWGYVLKGPNSEQAIAITLFPPRELLPSDVHPEREGAYYDMYLEFASWMLRELGWAD